MVCSKLIPVILGLGSNREFNGMKPVCILEKACHELSLILKTPVFSSVYITKAMYVEDQEDFHNMAVFGYVNHDENPFDLLKKVNLIEAKYGRDRSKEIRFGPRSLDIDIELFGSETIDDSILQIPHPRISERAFVLIPMLEIFPLSADKQIREKYAHYLDCLKKDGKTDDVVKFCPPLVVMNGTGR